MHNHSVILHKAIMQQQPKNVNFPVIQERISKKEHFERKRTSKKPISPLNLSSVLLLRKCKKIKTHQSSSPPTKKSKPNRDYFNYLIFFS